MISTILLNGSLGFAIVLAFLFCMGDMSVLESPTGYDFIEVFFNATKSHAGTSVMTAIPIVLVICASFGFLASASRLTWAFARDKGLPFADFLAYVTITHSFSFLHSFCFLMKLELILLIVLPIGQSRLRPAYSRRSSLYAYHRLDLRHQRGIDRCVQRHYLAYHSGTFRII